MFTPADVNIQRVLTELDALAQIGKTDEGGVTRPTFSGAHQAATGMVAEKMAEAGLDVTFDRWGNLYGRVEGSGEGPRVMSGSHLDSVPNGGNYDGVLGVLSALEAARLIIERGFELRKSLEIVSFIEEEGSRFQGVLGSKLACDELHEEDLSTLQDAEGNRFLDVLESVSFPFPTRQQASLKNHVDTFVELHIEQGKILEKSQTPVGLVTSIAGPLWKRIHIHGQPDHAGPTAYEDRRDALLAAAEVIVRVRKTAVSEFGQNGRMTVGKLEVQPNVINVVPGHVVADVDLRAGEDSTRRKLEAGLEAIVEHVCSTHGVGYRIVTLLDVAPAVTPDRVREAIAVGCEEASVAYQEVTSWAFHDAISLSHVCDAGMLFVPCRDGRSHSPEEYVEPKYIASGVAALANTLLHLALP